MSERGPEIFERAGRPKRDTMRKLIDGGYPRPNVPSAYYLRGDWRCPEAPAGREAHYWTIEGAGAYEVQTCRHCGEVRARSSRGEESTTGRQREKVNKILEGENDNSEQG